MSLSTGRREALQRPVTPEVQGGTVTPKQDNVNHPAHYTQGAVECIDAIKSALGTDGYKAFLRGNIIKYLWRAEHKNGSEDYQKAKWYMDVLAKEAQ